MTNAMPYPTTQTGVPAPSNAQHLLEQARQAAVQGNRQQAYQIALNATQAYPQDVDAWLMRAELAQSAEETVVCLNRVNAMHPQHPMGQQKTYMVLQNMLKVDPFLAYQKETDELYQVHNRDSLAVIVPKHRAIVEPYPNDKPNPLRAARKLFVMALVGLLPAGLLAIVFAPLTFLAALWANRKPLTRGQRVTSFMMILFSTLVFGFALFLVWLFINHFAGYAFV